MGQAIPPPGSLWSTPIPRVPLLTSGTLFPASLTSSKQQLLQLSMGQAPGRCDSGPLCCPYGQGRMCVHLAWKEGAGKGSSLSSWLRTWPSGGWQNQLGRLSRVKALSETPTRSSSVPLPTQETLHGPPLQRRPESNIYPRGQVADAWDSTEPPPKLHGQKTCLQIPTSRSQSSPPPSDLLYPVPPMSQAVPAQQEGAVACRSCSHNPPG